MKEYKIIQAFTIQKLIDIVNNFLESEWDLYGNLVYINGKYCQSIIRWRNQYPVDLEKERESFISNKSRIFDD